MLRFGLCACLWTIGCSGPGPTLSAELTGAIDLPALAIGTGTTGPAFERGALGFTRVDGVGGQQWQVGTKRGEVTVELAGAQRLTVTATSRPFSVGEAQPRGSAVVFRAAAGEAAIVLSPRPDGIKEDLVLTRPRGDRLRFEWRLDHGPELRARRDPEGSVGVYGPSGACYRFPAPVVRDAAGAEHRDLARFELKGDTLRLVVSGLSALPYPVTIDPTLLITTTADFALGGNDERNVSIALDQLKRVKTRGGAGSWAPTMALPVPSRGFASVVYNSNVYLVGGNTGAVATTVLYAPILLGGGGVGA